jgi:hypothetical protein
MITFGGNEYAADDKTEYILSKRRGHYNAYEDDATGALMNKLFYFLPKTSKFCSCLLYENLIKDLLDDIQPNLETVLENTKYPSNKDDIILYENLCKLNFQVAGWPFCRESSIETGKFRSEYWKFLGLESPKWHLIEMKQPTKEFINILLEEEEKYKADVEMFEKKLGEAIMKLSGVPSE